jgi:hypothetical protein
MATDALGVADNPFDSNHAVSRMQFASPTPGLSALQDHMAKQADALNNPAPHPLASIMRGETGSPETASTLSSDAPVTAPLNTADSSARANSRTPRGFQGAGLGGVSAADRRNSWGATSRGSTAPGATPGINAVSEGDQAKIAIMPQS